VIQKKRVKELREQADRLEASVSSTAGPSSEEWIPPELRGYCFRRADELRRKADRLEQNVAEDHAREAYIERVRESTQK
jgi:hypothetical protein